jgi:hypothetical protein
MTNSHFPRVDWQDLPDVDAVAQAIAIYLCRLASVDADRWAIPYQQRRSWGFPKHTLDEVGQQLQLTRERVRQVIAEIDEARPLVGGAMPDVVAEAGSAVVWEDDGEDISSVLAERGLASTHWTKAGLIDLISVCGPAELAPKLDELRIEGKTPKKLDDTVADAVRKARSGLGVLDLRTVSVNDSMLSSQDALEAVRQLYSTVVVVDDWVLCRTQRTSALENAAIQQLAISNCLSGPELYEGVSRTARNRKWVAPPESVSLQLLEQVGLIVSTTAGFQLREHAPPLELGEIEQWLVQTLRGEDPHALPVEELLRRCREDGLKSSSLSVYMTYSALVRRRKGLLLLVGTDPSDEEIAVLKRAAKAAEIPSDIRFSLHDRGVELEIELGTGYITSGVMTAHRGLRVHIDDQPRSFHCCDRQSFSGKAKLSSSSWYGWSPLFQHWLADHSVEEGDVVHVLMTEDMLICLEPWATPLPVDDESASEETAISVSTEPEQASPVETRESDPIPSATPTAEPSLVVEYVDSASTESKTDYPTLAPQPIPSVAAESDVSQVGSPVDEVPPPKDTDHVESASTSTWTLVPPPIRSASAELARIVSEVRSRLARPSQEPQNPDGPDLGSD